MKNASTASGASVSDAASKNEPTLQRGLQNRHIQLIALGGAIGTGLFLGIGPAIQMAGPAVLLGYGVAGIIAFLIMRQLGEMVVEEPVSVLPFLLSRISSVYPKLALDVRVKRNAYMVDMVKSQEV
ncbi:hypothetical protein, partial [Salmonella enterica]|uniref:hypothetical protein n=1 Tax=Salmonella enterica TaxID=28901 RepID=UPI001F3E589C